MPPRTLIPKRAVGSVPQSQAFDKGKQHEQLRGVQLSSPGGCRPQEDTCIQRCPPGSVYNGQLRPVCLPPSAGCLIRTLTHSRYV